MIAFTSISLALASLAVAAPTISPIPSQPTELSPTQRVLLKVANRGRFGAQSVYIGGVNHETGSLRTTTDPNAATQVHFKKVPQISDLVGRTQYYEMVAFTGAQTPLVVLNEQGHLMFGGSSPARSPPMGTWTSAGKEVPTESAIWYVNGRNEIEAAYTVLGGTKTVKMGLCYHVDPEKLGSDALVMTPLKKRGKHNCGAGGHGLMVSSTPAPRLTTPPVVDLD